jgi:RNA 3'-terminal phosphate cyclase (ATP)
MPRHNPKHPKHTLNPSNPHQKPTNSSDSGSQLPDSIRSDPSLIHLDGRTLEGGGQLVRLALTLSALTSIPIHVYSIRGKRSSHSSGRGGGLKSSHLAALEFLARATAARTYGADVGSTEIVFEPGRGRQILKDRSNGLHNGMNGKEVYEIRLDKPGSVWLILQAILPFVMFAASEHVPTELIITGGTNVTKSMSGEYVKQVMCPMFEAIGLPTIELDIRRRGWTHGRAIEIGEVSIKVHPLKKGAKLAVFNLNERGAITKIDISILAGTEAMRSALAQQATASLHEIYPHLPQPQVVVNETSNDPKRLYLFLVAHTASNYRLGRDWLYDEKMKTPLSDTQTELIATKMVQRVVDELDAEITHGGCVDEYMRDQLVVFEAIAEGRSRVDGGVGAAEGSLHTRTCRWVVEQVLAGQVSFDAVTGCTGVGFSPGEIYEERRGLEERIVLKNDEEGRDEADYSGDVEGGG